jgi:tetratricopeptide (TPR) repeat protein
MSTRQARGRKRTQPNVPTAPDPSRGATPARLALTALALVVLTLGVYWPVHGFPFVNWDDPIYVSAKPHVLAGLTRASVSWALTAVVAGNWHPLTLLSHMLDVEMFGADAGWHHATSLALHLGNTLLLFTAIYRLTGTLWRSAFVAAVFAVHPLHVESVAWVSERKDVLSTFFALVAILAYTTYVKRPTVLRYLTVFAMYALALLAKPMVVTLPVLLLLLDFWPLARTPSPAAPGVGWTRLIAEKVPLLGAAAAVGVVTIFSQGGTVARLDVLRWYERLANAVNGYVAYLKQTLLPINLAPFYPLAPIRWLAVAAGAAVLGAITAAVVRWRRVAPWGVTGWFWYVVALAPVAGLVQVGGQATADRYMYLPMVGLLVLAAWGLPQLAGPRFERALGAAALVLVALCVPLARAQVGYWADSLMLWQHAASVTTANYVAYEKQGEALRDLGRLDEAYAGYSQALAFSDGRSPRYRATLFNNLGLVDTGRNRPAAAEPEFRSAVELDPGFAEAHGNLGNVLAATGRLPEATTEYSTALRLDPSMIEAELGLGAALLNEHRAADALPDYEAAVEARPDMAEAHSGLGAALALTGHEDRAVAEDQRALALSPALASPHVNLAAVFASEGKIDEAINQLTQALARDAAEPGWHVELAQLLVERGRFADARSQLQAALAIDPEFAPARQALAALPVQHPTP